MINWMKPKRTPGIKSKTKKKIVLLLGFLLAAHSLTMSAFPGLPSGGGYSASLGAGAAVGYRRNALQNNPAAKDSVLWNLGFATSKPQGLDEMRNYHFSFALDGEKLGTMAYFYQSGITELYLEQAYQLQVSWWPVKQLGLGLKSSARKISIPTFGQTIFPGFGAGAILKPFGFLSIGAFLHDFSLPKYQPQIRELYQMGFSVGSFEKTRFLYDWRKRKNQPARILVGQTLSLAQNHVELVAGIATRPFQFSFGVQLSGMGVGLVQSMQHHDFLGLSLQSFLIWKDDGKARDL